MRTYELVLVAALALAVVWPAVFASRPRRGLVFLVLVGAVVAQWVIEGFRWQLLPLWVTALAMAVGDMFSMDRVLPWWRRASRPVLGLAGVAMMAVPAVVFPVPILPIPSGPLAIGTSTFELVFTEREEPYGETPGQPPRRIMVQAWYPAEQGAAQPAAWNPDLDIIGPALSKRLGFPGFFLNHTALVSDHAVVDAQPLSGTFPVVIYSHGWAGFRTVALNQLESLASHGYVVLAADHTHAALTTRFPDGLVVPFDPTALPRTDEVDKEVYDRAAQLLVETFTDDLTGILDALGEGGDGPFAAIADHTDLGRIGLYGHSTGGGAALWVCLSDERCTAVLGMDPWVEPLPDRVVATSATRPMLFMRSDGWRNTPNDGRLRGLSERSQTVVYWLGVQGAEHNDFVMAPLLSPFASAMRIKGPIPSGRMITIVDRFLVGFFDVYLLGTGPAAIEAASFTDISLEVIDNRPSAGG